MIDSITSPPEGTASRDDIPPAVSILVPAYNEAAAIGDVLAGVQRVQATLDCSSEVLVIDDGSTDATGRVAAEAGVRVLTHPYNLGKGAALKTGIRAARGRTVVVIDSDGQHDPNDIPRLLAFRPAYDMVMGDRGHGGGASPLWRTPGKALLGAVANFMAGRTIPDLNCGLRAVDRQLALRLLPILPNGFSFETTITIATLKGGDTIHWVPVHVAPRIGKSMVTVYDGLNTFMLIFRLVSLFSPLRIFLPISAVAFAVGVWFMVESYLLYQEASVKALLAMLASVLFFLFGLLADQIAALRRGEAAYRRSEQVQLAIPTLHMPGPSPTIRPSAATPPDGITRPADMMGDASPLEAR
ncbi:MAG: glycosyltransferase family 2 protein [Chloroflexi bacterium]|nr:glycosyltransferase family 2 protein [Chloroflexota bacterium]